MHNVSTWNAYRTVRTVYYCIIIASNRLFRDSMVPTQQYAIGIKILSDRYNEIYFSVDILILIR